MIKIVKKKKNLIIHLYYRLIDINVLIQVLTNLTWLANHVVVNFRKRLDKTHRLRYILKAI